MNNMTDVPINVFDETRQFLEAIWGLYTSQSLYFEIFCINQGKTMVKFFEGVSAPREAVEWLEKNFAKLANDGWHIFFGVLPRCRKPEKGRGKESDVDRGLWLWADLDYKIRYDKLDDVPIPEEAKKQAEINGYWFQELDDYALIGVYRDGSKWIYVERPSLTKLLEDIRSKLEVEPTIVVDSGNGYHLYFKLAYEIDAKTLKKIESLLVDILDADPKSKDLARVLRLPGSINPRINRLVRVIYWSTSEIDPSEFLSKLEEIRKQVMPKLATADIHHITTHESDIPKLRELSDKEILEIVNLLKDIYQPENRQFLCLYLSGWAAKAKIDPCSIAKIIKMLHDETGDEDPLKMRLSTIVYSYKKNNLWNEDIQHRFEELLREWEIDKVSGLESKLDPKRIKGKSGIQEIAEAILGEERALELIRRLEEIFGTASPFRDSIFELLDYEKQLYAVANLRKLVIARVRKKDNQLIYKERIAPVAPTRVVVYINPLGGITKYEITFEGQTLRRPLVIGPATLEDIISRLKVEGLVYHRRLIEDVLSALIQGYIRKGKAEIKEEIEAPGFYLINGEIRVVRWEIKEVSKEELREALELLNELALVWYEHAVDRFALVIKWGVIAPFIYAMKQKGKWIPWLYLYGASKTGKTTLGEIVLNMWNLDIAHHKKSGGNIDTVPRLGHVLSQTTFPILINEPGGAIYREDVVEVMKAAVESTIARGKYVRGTYVDIPALAPLIIASNKVVPRDDALLRRLIIVRFTFGEKIDTEREKAFGAEIKPKLRKLAAIGFWIAKKVIENPSLLDNEWIELAEKLLEEAYREAGLEPPSWIKRRYELDEDPYENMREAIRIYLVKRINEEYNRFVGRVVVEKEDGSTFLNRTEVAFADRVRIVLENRLLPWAILRSNTVYITSGFVDELKNITGDIGGLKSIAELLGWQYKQVKISKRVVRAIAVDIDTLIDFLLHNIHDDNS